MAQVARKDCLPNGWIVRPSSKYPERIYYFNTLTGNSTWECPELVPRSGSNGNEAAATDNGKEVPAYKPTLKRLSPGQANIAGKQPARISHTPVGSPFLKKSPQVSVDGNVQKKRKLEPDSPTPSRSVHSPREVISFHKPSPVNIHNQIKPKLEPGATSTPKMNVSRGGLNIVIPTAIVTPVVTGQEKTSTQASKPAPQAVGGKKKRNRRKRKKNQWNVATTSAALPSTTVTQAKQKWNIASTTAALPSTTVTQAKQKWNIASTTAALPSTTVTQAKQKWNIASTTAALPSTTVTQAKQNWNIASMTAALPSTKVTQVKQKGSYATTAAALPLKIKEEKKSPIQVPLPKNEPKTLVSTPPISKLFVNAQNKPVSPSISSLSAPTSYENNEIVSTDSDMDFELGASLSSIPSTSRDITAFEHSSDLSWEEVEMLDVSADLRNLDEIVPPRDPYQLNSHYIVIDTNVLIHELVHIAEIKETPLQGCGPPHIIIPWVVFQELDRLKSHNDTVGKAAQKAVRYLHNILKSKHPRFHGQSGEDAHKLKREYHDSNDDKIIDLCLSLRKKMDPEKVILMTNDKNLANKAMVYEIIVHDWSSLLKDIVPDIPIQGVSSKKKRTKKKGDQSVPAIMIKEKSKLLNERSACEKDIEVLMAEARQMLKNALDPFLVEEMQKAYGSAWENFQIDRRLLREILSAYIKFWPTVFYSHFNNKLKNSFVLLHQKATCPEGFYGTLEECLVILHAMEDIFRAIIKVRPNMSSLINNIQSLQEHYTRIFSKHSNVDSTISNVEQAIQESAETLVLEILNRNWTVINELCGMIMDFYGVQHNFEYVKPAVLPPESEYRRVVADLYPSLLQLKQTMKKVVELVINSTPGINTFKKFARGLKELVPSLNIEFVMPDMAHFSAKAVEQFCRNPENRQKIQFGYTQLEHFCNKLNEAIQSMISFKKNRPSTT